MPAEDVSITGIHVLACKEQGGCEHRKAPIALVLLCLPVPFILSSARAEDCKPSLGTFYLSQDFYTFYFSHYKASSTIEPNAVQRTPKPIQAPAWFGRNP
jgi:hypothetical protein